MSSISPRVRHARLRELFVPAHLLASKEGLFLKKDTKFKAPESSVLRPLQGSRVECGAIGQASPVFVHLRTRCFLSRAYYTGCAPVYSSEIIKKGGVQIVFFFFFFSGVDGGGRNMRRSRRTRGGEDKARPRRRNIYLHFCIARRQKRSRGRGASQNISGVPEK